MPFTPYHFGPSGFIALTFRKWIDVPVFIMANIAIDIEVLVIGYMKIGWPYHRYCHSILGGLIIGIALALIAYPCIPIFKWAMNLARIPYQTSLKKLIISGILGCWLHILIDEIYHWDLLLFRPLRLRPLYKLLTKSQLETTCLIFWALMLIPYIIAVRQYHKNKTPQKEENTDPTP